MLPVQIIEAATEPSAFLAHFVNSSGALAIRPFIGRS